VQRHYLPSTISPRLDPRTGLCTRDENFDCIPLRILVVANTLYQYELAFSVEKNNQIEISLFMLPPHIVNSRNGEFILIIAILTCIIIWERWTPNVGQFWG
jgi:hypothetical protein